MRLQELADDLGADVSCGGYASENGTNRYDDGGEKKEKWCIPAV